MKNKNNDALWLALAGVMLAAILLMVGLGDAQDRALYEQGRGALLAGDCAQAVTVYDSLLSAPRALDMRGFAYRAGREKEQCQMFQQAAAQEREGRPGDAAATYYQLMKKYGDTPLFAMAKANLTAIINNYDVDRLASLDFCGNFAGVASGGQMDYADSSQTFPMIVDACGRMYEAQGDFTSAIVWYNDFLEGHMQHDWSTHFREALARAMLSQARRTGSQVLPAPVWVGEGTGSTFVLTVYNESPHPARVVLTGPATQIVRVAGCANCEPIPATGLTGQECPRRGRSTSFELPVGTYHALVESGSGESTRIFQAAWKLSTGRYETCFAPAPEEARPAQ